MTGRWTWSEMSMRFQWKKKKLCLICHFRWLYFKIRVEHERREWKQNHNEKWVWKYYKERLMVELQSRYIEASNRFSDNLITEIKGNWADEVGEISGSVEIENEGAEDHWSVNLRNSWNTSGKGTFSGFKVVLSQSKWGCLNRNCKLNLKQKRMYVDG